MPFYGQRKYDHSVEINKPCCKICGKPFLMYWKDKDERNGFSDTVTHIGRDEVHYYCTPNAKSLHELNQERKNLIS